VWSHIWGTSLCKSFAMLPEENMVEQNYSP
jgi:hypothetical protein